MLIVRGVISLLPSGKRKGENLPLPAAGEISYVPVDGHAVLPKLFATLPSDLKCVYLPAL